MTDQASLDAIRTQVLAALRTRPFLSALGVEVTNCEAGRVSIRMPVRRDGDAETPTDPAQGSVDRSIVTALAEAACWLAVVSAGSPAKLQSQLISTLEMKVDLIASDAPLTALEATGEVQRLGRSLSSARATVVGLETSGDRLQAGLVQATLLTRER